MAVILNAAGTPEPSPQVQRRLRAAHPGLFLRFLPQSGEHWAICLEWGANDPRRAKLQDGSVDPARAHDIIGFLPMTCSADEAPAYLERSFRTFPREDVQRMADDVTASFSAPAQQAVEQAIAEVLDNPNPAGTPKRRRKS
jgi:hypothetical protein